MHIVYLNGEYIPLAEARISVLDRGFTFADGVYEVLPVYYGKVFRQQEHLLRLNNSLTAIYIENPLPSNEWKKVFTELIKRNHDTGNQQLYVHISRGESARNHLFEEQMDATVFAMCRPLEKKGFENGISAITHDDIRWQYCHIKSTALLANVLLKKKAQESNNAKAAILLRDEFVTEGTASNVFVVKDSKVKTPAKDGNILAGITRDLLVELLQKSNIECEEMPISYEELTDADEIWLTSSTMGIVSVVKLDERLVGSGKPGELWKQANAMFETFTQSAS